MSSEKIKYKPQIKYRISNDDLKSRGIYEKKKPFSFMPSIAEFLDYLLKGLVIWVIYTGASELLNYSEINKSEITFDDRSEIAGEKAALAKLNRSSAIAEESSARAQLRIEENQAASLSKKDGGINGRSRPQPPSETTTEMLGRILNRVNDEINGAASSVARATRDTFGIKPAGREQ